VAQLIGLALSVALLNGIDATGDPTNAVWAWVAIQSVHVALRYKSLSVIQLPTLNQKRSCALVNAYLQGQQLPGKPVASSPMLMCPWCMHACTTRLSRFSNSDKHFTGVPANRFCQVPTRCSQGSQGCFKTTLPPAMGSSMHQHIQEMSMSVQIYKRSSEAAVTDNADYRQVQLEQSVVHCIALLEALQPAIISHA